jgi:predicted MPP superfamily phosphohydrolase
MTAPPSKVENATGPKAGAPDSDPDGFNIPLSRLVIWLTLMTTILLAAATFVCMTWNHFWNNPTMPAWQIIPPVLTLMFIVTTILGKRHSTLWLRLAYRVSAIWIGVLNFCFFAACAAWIFSAAAVLLRFHAGPKIIAAIFFGGAIFISIYGLVNAFWLRVTRVTARLANLPENWSGRSVALVTDLHLGNVRGVGLSRRVVAALQQLQPEAVLISGDLFDGSKADLHTLIEPWKKISASSGIYFVTGNHEEFGAREKYLEAIARAGIRVLNNEKVDVNGMQIVGVHDGELHDSQVFRKILQGAELDRNRPSILLAHQPSNLAIAGEEGVSFQVSGHTHGGQLWPWTWVAARVHGPFNHGLNRLGKMLVHTSNGVGTWGAPMRVGTKSEIVLLRLEPAGK